MDNPICDIKVLYSPNRRYANTINLVFFRAYPLYKNFEIYVEGLKKWKEYIKIYPDSQIQIFIDEDIAENDRVMKIIQEVDARIYLVKCSDFLITDKYHIGIFPMFWRMFPMFDIYKHSFKAAHSQELEPAKEDIRWFKHMNTCGNLKYPDLGFIYRSISFFTSEGISGINFEQGIPYPKVFGGRIIVRHQAPFELLTNFFEKVNRGDKIVQLYDEDKVKKEHGNYAFGIDESFLNTDFLEWYIKQDLVIGIFTTYTPSYPIFFRKQYIHKHSKSKEIMDYILQKKQSLDVSLKQFDKLFYMNDPPTTVSQYIKQCADRFYEIVEKYPNWLGKEHSHLIEKAFKGAIFKDCLILTKRKKIVDVIELT
jgi:hypothetical protein